MQNSLSTEIRTLKQYLGENPGSMLFARLADKYLQLHEVEKAIDVCQGGLRHHPNYSSAHFVLAKCLLARKEYEEAERRLKQVLSLEPRFLQAHKLYSELLTQRNGVQSGLANMEKIREIDPFFQFDESRFKSKSQEFSGQDVELDKLMGDVHQRPAELEIPTPELEEEKLEPIAPAPEVDFLPTLEETPIATGPLNDFEQEEVRFSEILDDLFSSSMLEEERREREARTTIERVAQQETFVEARPEKSARPPAEPKETPPVPDDSELVPPSPATVAAPELKETPPVPDVPESPATFEAPETPTFEEPDERIPEQKESSEPEFPAQDQTFPPISETEEENAWDAFEPLMPKPPQPETEAGRSEQEGFAASPGEDLATPEEPPSRKQKPEEYFDDRGLDLETEEEELEADEEEFSQFLSTLDRMGSDDEISFDADQEQEPEEPISFASPNNLPDPYAQKDSEESEFHIDAKSRAERPKEKFVTPTLGEIYAAQGQYAKAISVFDLLLKKNPENEWYKTKLQYLRRKLEEENL